MKPIYFAIFALGLAYLPACIKKKGTLKATMTFLEGQIYLIKQDGGPGSVTFDDKPGVTFPYRLAQITKVNGEKVTWVSYMYVFEKPVWQLDCSNPILKERLNIDDFKIREVAQAEKEFRGRRGGVVGGDTNPNDFAENFSPVLLCN